MNHILIGAVVGAIGGMIFGESKKDAKDDKKPLTTEKKKGDDKKDSE